MRPAPTFRVLSRLETGRVVLYSALAGVITGLAGSGLRVALEYAQRYLLGTSGYAPPGLPSLGGVLQTFDGGSRWWLLLILPLALALAARIYPARPWSDALGEAIGRFHGRGEPDGRLLEEAYRTAAGVTVLGAGVPLGRDGPYTSLGVLAGELSQRFGRLSPQDARTVLMSGVAAGLGLALGAPLAAAIFVVEVLYRRFEFEFELAVPAMLASVSAYAIYSGLFGYAPLFDLPALEAPAPALLPAFLLLGAVQAGAATLFVELLARLRENWEALRVRGRAVPRELSAATIGLLLAAVGLAFPGALGEGLGWLQLTLSGLLSVNEVGQLAFWKLMALLLVASLGAAGGLLIPGLLIGGLLGALGGSLLGNLFPGLPISTPAFALVGAAAFVAAAAKTPLSAALLVVGWGGDPLLVPLLVACVAAFAISSNASLFPQQVDRRSDSGAHLEAYLTERLGPGTRPEDLEAMLPQPVALPPDENVQAASPDLLGMLEQRPVEVLDGDTEQLYRRPLPNGWVGQLLGSLRWSGDAAVVALVRGGQVQIPRDSTVFEEGDELVLIATPEGYTDFEATFAPPTAESDETAAN
ncbi:H+/Cl- antiporter ClcA [Deinobacterium chartae]|uniref:H+/Cl- antiporter ClcA n=1 Tax=Deinobacterium chartae TaxID=521158 RepID=A0A841I3G8_9DEIO|nr:chloride channel protein [Deinobacterium chartae]MBB6098465.1 H+/Cl- antiporter ClcA [Deinobacterium chartae]